jgi:AcrR family transcriptional regulator
LFPRTIEGEVWVIFLGTVKKPNNWQCIVLLFKLIVILLFIKSSDMQNINVMLNLSVNEHLYLKDPESSKLGQRLLQEAVNMVSEIGFETFTFAKLANNLGSTEGSMYRYFESKHKLLLYLTNKYWQSIEYLIDFRTANISSNIEQMIRAVTILTEDVKEDEAWFKLNAVKLKRIIIAESSKAYLTKEVDIDNNDGLFTAYKSLVSRVAQIIQQIRPTYPYPRMLVTTIIEGAHHQKFFSIHLPSLTDVKLGEDTITEFYTQLILKELEIKNHV